jgi:hypothetical protein
MLTLLSYTLALLLVVGCVWWASKQDQDKT